jgi:ankyrin repeat protein
MLLERGADANVAFADGETLLCKATSKGLVHVVQQLLKSGADPNVSSKRLGYPISIACSLEKNYTSIVEILLNSGADPNVSTAHPISPLPLCTASYYYESDIAELLWQHGVVINHDGANQTS